MGALLLAGGGERSRQHAEDAPNFLVIMTDDQTLNEWKHEFIPETLERLVA